MEYYYHEVFESHHHYQPNIPLERALKVFVKINTHTTKWAMKVLYDTTSTNMLFEIFLLGYVS